MTTKKKTKQFWVCYDEGFKGNDTVKLYTTEEAALREAKWDLSADEMATYVGKVVPVKRLSLSLKTEKF